VTDSCDYLRDEVFKGYSYGRMEMRNSVEQIRKEQLGIK
jgi:hypothetical protein